jgi:hypothetical protein
MVNGTLEPDRAAKRATGDAPRGHAAVRVVAWIAFAVLVPAALLTAVGPSLASRLMRTHPERAEIAPDAPDPRATIARLESLDPRDGDAIDEQALAEAARLISGAIVDHWPRGDEIDPAVATTLLEHPPRWAAIQLVRALPASWESRVPNHAERMRIERRDWRSAVMLGVGTDGQRALALARYLREKGVDAWPVVAEGRAVCVLGEPEATRGVDPASGAPIEIAARAPYPESTTLLSRRARVWWTLALGALALVAWGAARGRIDPRWSVLALPELAHLTGVPFLWFVALLVALAVVAWMLRTRRVQLPFLRQLNGAIARLSRAARGSSALRAILTTGCACGAAASACVALGSVAAAAVLALGPSFADRFLATHPLRLDSAECKPGLACIDADEAIARLEALDPTTEDGLIEANGIFAAALLHHWPRYADEAPPTAVRVYEDLPRWLDMKISAVLGDRDEWAAAAWSERGRWRSAIRMGVGFCSQHAIAISDYLREKGVEARPFGLAGHVVARVQAPGGEWILDPDYALVIPRSIEEAGADFEGTRDAYLAVGVESSIAASVAATFGPEGNAEYTITFVGTDHARLDAWLRRAFILLLASGGLAWGLRWLAGLLGKSRGAERAASA